MTIKILYYGSCWPTNIGNAFVNLGAIQSLKAALGTQAQIMHFGGLSSYLFWSHNQPQNNLNIAEMANFDYVVMGGMTQCISHLQANERIITSFIERGAKIVIAGGGAGTYDDNEVEAVRRLMTRLPIYAFVSRDTYSYEKYGDLATYSFDGIDSAFFASDGFTPIPLDIPDFNVLTFDNIEAPMLMNEGDSQRIEALNQVSDNFEPEGIPARVRGMVKRLLGRNISEAGSTSATSPIDLERRIVLRTHHSCWPTVTKTTYFKQPNTLISDLPSDYLSLYAQAHTVYSERVHACIPTLAFGNRAMLFGHNVPRIRMFERVGAGEILERPVQLDRNNLVKEKRKQVEFFASVLT